MINSVVQMDNVREKSPEFIPFNQKSLQSTLANKTNEPIRNATRRRKSLHPCSLSSRLEQNQWGIESPDEKQNFLLTEDSSDSHLNDENESKGVARDSVLNEESPPVVVVVPNNPSKSKRKRLYRCRQCSFVSSIKEEYWKHHRVHLRAEKMLQCQFCPFVTKYKHHFDYHLRNHLGSKPFKCSQCDYSCINRAMLRSHQKSHLRDLPCDTSPKESAVNSICDEETQVDQWQLQHLFPCSHCQMIFRDFILYCTHKHFHYSAENPFRCSQCGEQKSNSYEFFLHLIEQAHPLP